MNYYLQGYQDGVKQAAGMTLVRGVRLARRARRIGILTEEARQAVRPKLQHKRRRRRRK